MSTEAPMRTAEQRDQDLELAIDREYAAMLVTHDEESRGHFLEMAKLIRQRSPIQIEKMELERRLLGQENQRLRKEVSKKVTV